MGKKSRQKRERWLRHQTVHENPEVPLGQTRVHSLLDVMQDGNEYQSIVDKVPENGTNLLDEVVRGISEIEATRMRPCILYVGNMIKRDPSGGSGIDTSDDLPFREMVAKVPKEQRCVDVFLATMGGSAQQVNNFVNCLRSRFDEVDFLIPSFCMSAGTLFALSGDRIWMPDGACLGPIDPQVPVNSGRFVPAQAIFALLSEIQRVGADALKKGQPVPWAYVRVIDSLDKKELGEAITASQYSETMAAQFLSRYKFRKWNRRETSGTIVSEEDRVNRAKEIASLLGSHDHWKSHGHALTRQVLVTELQLKVDQPDPRLGRAMARMWALLAYMFDKTPLIKILCSANYRYVRNVQVQVLQPNPGDHHD